MGRESVVNVSLLVVALSSHFRPKWIFTNVICCFFFFFLFQNCGNTVVRIYSKKDDDFFFFNERWYIPRVQKKIYNRVTSRRTSRESTAGCSFMMIFNISCFKGPHSATFWWPNMPRTTSRKLYDKWIHNSIDEIWVSVHSCRRLIQNILRWRKTRMTTKSVMTSWLPFFWTGECPHIFYNVVNGYTVNFWKTELWCCIEKVCNNRLWGVVNNILFLPCASNNFFIFIKRCFFFSFFHVSSETVRDPTTLELGWYFFRYIGNYIHSYKTSRGDAYLLLSSSPPAGFFFLCAV